MTPFSKRNLFIIFSVISFAVLLYGINKFVPVFKNSVEHLEFIALSFLVLISVVIMLFWSVLGVFCGLTAFLISLIFLYGPLTDLNPYYYSVLILVFFISSFLGYYIHRKITLFSQQYTVKKQRIQEDTNLLTNHVKNRRAEVDAMEDKNESLLRLKNIANSLSFSFSQNDIIKILADETFNVFGKDNRVLLFIFDGNKEITLSSAVKPEGRKTFEMKNGGLFERWVMKNLKSLLVKDISKDFRFSTSGKEINDDAVSLMIKPLMVENNMLGILRVDSDGEEAYGQHELRILDIVGDLAGVALENARLYRQTEELAIRDSLTGLYVHRHFIDRFDEEIKRALRSDGSFALLMIDIDNFKDFNDKNGHVAGDAVLRNIGKILTEKSSAGDIVGRYGGEEFTFLVLNCNKKNAIRTAEKIRREVQNNSVTLRRKKYSVTVSIGVSVFPEDAKLRDDLIWEADRYLYQAKSKGKNKVCSK